MHYQLKGVDHTKDEIKRASNQEINDKASDYRALDACLRALKDTLHSSVESAILHLLFTFSHKGRILKHDKVFRNEPFSLLDVKHKSVLFSLRGDLLRIHEGNVYDQQVSLV